MNTMVRNVAALPAGLVVGSVVNMGLVLLGPVVFSPPSGADVTTTEGLKAALPFFEPKHFVFPFLAHALGTLAGAALAAALAASRKMLFAMLVGLLFFTGGVANILMLPSPVWFTVLDLVGAYIPMAWLGARLGGRNTPSQGK